MPKRTLLYESLKGKAYGVACVAAGRDNASAKAEGSRDVFDLIMSDSNHARQPAFTTLLMDELSEKQRQILLDGMAQEYAECDGWMAYVDRECED